MILTFYKRSETQKNDCAYSDNRFYVIFMLKGCISQSKIRIQVDFYLTLATDLYLSGNKGF